MIHSEMIRRMSVRELLEWEIFLSGISESEAPSSGNLLNIDAMDAFARIHNTRFPS